MTVDTLTAMYRSTSDNAQVVTLMAESGDPDACELIEYLVWASNALGTKLERKLARLNKKSS